MTHHTDAERAEFEDWLGIKPCGAAHDLAWSAWKAARRAVAAPVPQIDPVHGDCLPPIGSRVFIRHGRDDDAHACIVTGYYAWGDLKGSKHLHRVFVQLVYEGTDTKQARMLCDCYATADDALVAAPQPPKATVNDSLTVEAAPVQLPEAAATVLSKLGTTCMFPSAEISKGAKLYTEQQVREILKAHGINVKKSDGGIK